MAVCKRLCALCNKEIDSELTPVVCVRCHALYHPDCWLQIDRCAVFACNEPKDSYGLIGSAQAEAICASCGNHYDSAAQFCLSCGREDTKPISRQAFVSSAGWRAVSEEELVQQLGAHWESGVKHLYGGDVEFWLRHRGREDWAAMAKKIRTSVKQRSIGLETFLLETKLFQPPILSVNPKRIIVESAAEQVEAALDISNVGTGYFSGNVSSDMPWVSIDESDLIGNYNRLELRIDMLQVPEEGGSGKLIINGSGCQAEVEVKATRLGIDSALKAYRDGNKARARALCRRLSEGQLVSADAAVMLAYFLISEEDHQGVASVLSRISGACIHIDAEMCETVYRWLQQEAHLIKDFDSFPVLEAILPLATGKFKDDVKASLARKAVERVITMGDALGSGIQLWQDDNNVTQDANDLLQMAVDLDPGVRQNAEEASKYFRGGKAKHLRDRWASKILLFLVVGLFLAALAWALYGQKDGEFKPIARLLEANRFSQALQEVQEMRRLNGDGRYDGFYVRVLEAKAREDILNGKWASVAQSVEQISALAGENFSIYKMASESEARLALAASEAGNKEEARIYYESALNIDPQNALGSQGKEELEVATSSFWKVCQATDILGDKVHTISEQNNSVNSALQFLSSLGMRRYQGQQAVVWCDMDGDGHRELVTCGHDNVKNTPSHAKTFGGFAVYRLQQGHLNSVYSDEVKSCTFLQECKTADFSGSGRGDVAMIWKKNSSAQLGRLVLLACHQGHYVKENAGMYESVKIGDYDSDGRAEVWVFKPATKGEPVRYARVFTPMFWNEPGLLPATGDFKSFYRRELSELKRAQSNNHYKPGTVEYNEYNKQHEEAIVEEQKRLSGPTE